MRIKYLSAITVLILSFVLVFASQVDAKIRLRAVSAWPIGYPSVDKFREWVEVVNEKGKGRIEIDLIGGPEVTSMEEQIGALKRGVFEILLTASGYYMGMIPEAEAFGLSRLSPQEERANGFSDLMIEIHQKNGLMYIGRAMSQVPLGVLCINKKIERPQDLQGQKIRTVIIYDAFIKELGAVPATISVPEIYTSLERGLVDGFVQPLAGGFTRLGFHEVVKYIVNHYFYQIPTVALANLRAWNNIPEQDRELLIDTIKEIEITAAAYYKNIHDTELEIAQEMGVELIEFSPEDAEWYVNTAYRVGWDNLSKKAPDYTPQLRKLSDK